MQEEGGKHGSWPLGRIKQVHPGQDGIVYVVGVCTKTGVYMNLVMKIDPLEACHDNVVPQGGNVTESASDSRVSHMC